MKTNFLLDDRTHSKSEAKTVLRHGPNVLFGELFWGTKYAP
jgi:hypothetical protein